MMEVLENDIDELGSVLSDCFDDAGRGRLALGLRDQLAERLLRSDWARQRDAKVLTDAAATLRALGRGCAPEYAAWLEERAAEVRRG